MVAHTGPGFEVLPAGKILPLGPKIRPTLGETGRPDGFGPTVRPWQILPPAKNSNPGPVYMYYRLQESARNKDEGLVLRLSSPRYIAVVFERRFAKINTLLLLFLLASHSWLSGTVCSKLEQNGFQDRPYLPVSPSSFGEILKWQNCVRVRYYRWAVIANSKRYHNPSL